MDEHALRFFGRMSGIRPWLRTLWRLHTSTISGMALSLAALLVLLQSIRSASIDLIKPAWHDIWDWVPDYQRWLNGHYGWRDLLAPYYEHRIVLTKVLLLLDSVLDGMNGRIEQAVALALLAGLGILIWQMVRLEAPGGELADTPPLFWVALLSALCQYENIDLPFQVQFPIACFSAGAATLLLAKATLHTGRRAVLLAGSAGFAGIVAAFSMGSGVLLAPCLFALLIMRRARLIVWAAFAPTSILGLILFFRGHQVIKQHPMPLLDWHLAVVRAIYSFNFLGSCLGGFPALATWAGFCALVLFGIVCAGLARDFLLFGKPVAAGDAALFALCLLVVLCAPAGTLTGRLIFGTPGALASRYATMSLLFAAALFGLGLRWAGRVRLGKPGNAVLLSLGLVILLLVNAPIYFQRAMALQRTVLADTQLLINNVGVAGRADPIIFGTVDTVRNDIAILHAHKLNMFDPANGPPKALLSQLRNADLTKLPPCRGSVDAAYAVDDAGFLIAGWMTDQAGQHTAPWIAALDAKGNVLGTARALTSRDDVRAELGMKEAAYGFDDGFRLQEVRPTGASAVHLLGLFPGAEAPICAWPGAAQVGPLAIIPASQLRNMLAARLVDTPTLSGFVPADQADLSLHPAPPGVMAWSHLVSRQPSPQARIVFRLSPTPTGQALAVPFIMDDPASGHRLVVTMADGANFTIPVTPLWHDNTWRAVVIPGDALALHGGAVSIALLAEGDTWLAVGAPLTASFAAQWSKLF